MNLRLFSIALLISALPVLASAGHVNFFEKGDFTAAERSSKTGETVISLKLSKSGKAKLKKLNETAIGQEIKTEIAGISKSLILREAITGDALQMGPYNEAAAEKVVAEINR